MVFQKLEITNRSRFGCEYRAKCFKVKSSRKHEESFFCDNLIIYNINFRSRFQARINKLPNNYSIKKSITSYRNDLIYY